MKNNRRNPSPGGDILHIQNFFDALKYWSREYQPGLEPEI